MSRLYAWVESDTGRNGRQRKTITGNERIQITVHYDSSKKSKRACYMYVEYPEGAEKPTVYFSKEDV